MISPEKERKILLLSFLSGVVFAIVELIYSILSHSQSVLMDAVYDSAELIFIALTLFLTPFFRKPISEKHPYGFFQLESIFLIIKGFMLLSVSLGVGIDVIESIIDGGNRVNEIGVAVFQLILGIISVFIYLTMKKWNKKASSPTVDAEIMGWKIDYTYSFGLSFAFFGSTFLSYTPLKGFAPYFDQIVALIVMVIMMPDTIIMLKGAFKDVVLFSPDEETVKDIKQIATEVLEKYNFITAYVDVTRTGRHMWVDIYYRYDNELLPIEDLKKVTSETSVKVNEKYENSTIELILAREKKSDLSNNKNDDTK